jgi:hypothetical protein
MLTVLDEAPSDEERQQSLDNCIELLVSGCDMTHTICNAQPVAQRSS